MSDAFHQFITAYQSAFSRRFVYTDKIPKEMMASPVDGSGWFEWRPLTGTLTEKDYQSVEREFDVRFPTSFVEWHKAYFFLDGDCRLVRLPSSNPLLPLQEIKSHLDWSIPQQIIPKMLYPFASDGNDIGSWVFDGRVPVRHNEFPIRVYDHEFGGANDGLSDVIFSSFPKLIECITHFLIEIKSKNDFEVIPDFFEIDPEGAGKSGIDYWLSWTSMLRGNFEEFSSDDN